MLQAISEGVYTRFPGSFSKEGVSSLLFLTAQCEWGSDSVLGFPTQPYEIGLTSHQALQECRS